MTEKDYQALAIEERARRQAAADQAEIDAIANHMRETDEREARHASLRRKHGLPDTATLRQIADAEIAYDHGWRSYVANRFGGSARTSHVLDPEGSGHTDPAQVTELKMLRDKLRKQFEASWPPADLAERIGSTDSLSQSQGHNTARAA
jgi:hypothetical protein